MYVAEFLKTKNAARGAALKVKFSTYFKIYSRVAVLDNSIPDILVLLTQRKDTIPTTITIDLKLVSCASFKNYLIVILIDIKNKCCFA